MSHSGEPEHELDAVQGESYCRLDSARLEVLCVSVSAVCPPEGQVSLVPAMAAAGKFFVCSDKGTRKDARSSAN